MAEANEDEYDPEMLADEEDEDEDEEDFDLNSADEEEDSDTADDDDDDPLNSEITLYEGETDRPAERSGHIAVADGNYMYVWGGYKNSRGTGHFDFYLPRGELWIYNMETEGWQKRQAEGDVPPSMSGSCAVCMDGVLYLFGGHHNRGNTNRCYRLPLRCSTLTWEKMKDLKGLPPTCKDKLGCWVYNNRLVYFGGYGYAASREHIGTFEYDETSFFANGSTRGWNNHVHMLDLGTLTWSQPVTKGYPPSPRAAHACATLGNRGYVFGGRYREYRLNDLFFINLDTWEWTEMCVPQHGPVGRSWHSFTPVSPDHLFLFGGFTTDKRTLSDAWLYCVSKNEWKPFKHNHTKSPRLWHTACTSEEGEVIVFGGCANNLLSQQFAAHSNKILIFSVQPKSLVRSCMEAVLWYKDILAGAWQCLPPHLLRLLSQRLDSTVGSSGGNSGP